MSIQEAARKLYEPSEWGLKYHSLPHNEALGGGAAGPGKALCIKTPILTTTGWKRMGDIRPGDYVFNERGQPCAVLGASQVMYDHDCYLVQFDDGSSIVADGEHIWETIDYRARETLRRQEKIKRQRRVPGLDQRHKCNRPGLRSTVQIRDSLEKKGRINHAIMLAGPIQMPEADLSIDPYVLGAWLGDGSSDSGCITSMDHHVVARVASRGGFLVKELPNSSKNSGRASLWSIYGLTKRLRELGLIKNKHIPTCYLLGSELQRLELLKGLVDTDGHVDTDGRVEVCLSREELALGVYELVASLGLKVTFSVGESKLRGVVVGVRYRICFSPMGKEVCSLPRKAKRLGTGQRTQRWRYILSVRPHQSVPVRCLYVDTPSHLYLAGKTLIPTHNTQCLLMEPFQQIAVEDERCLNEEHPHPLTWGGSTGHAIFLRRTHPELNDVVKRAHLLFRAIDPRVQWNENKHQFIFRSGYIYQFGHCHDKDDWGRYFGFQFSMVLFDELIFFEEEQYDQINSRLRSSDPVLRNMLKIRSMTNPMMQRKQGDNFSITDPNWVRRRFVDPHPEGEMTLVKEIRMDDGSVERWTSIYMPALLKHNPDPEFRRNYEINLQQKKPHIRQALLRGDWYTTEGSFHAEEWVKELHVIRPFEIPKDWPKWRSMDWGYKKPGCIHWWAMDEDGNVYCVREMMFQGKTDEEMAEAIVQVEQAMKWSKGRSSKLTGPADTQLWEQRGESGKTKAQVMADKGVYWTKADKRSRLRNAELLTARLKDHSGGTTTPGVVFFDCCEKIIQMIPAVQTSDKNSEEPADGNDDHPYDSCLYSMAYASHGRTGLGWSSKDAEDDDDKPDKDPAPRRGRWGYGSELM